MLLALLAPYDLVRKLAPKERRKEAEERAKAIAGGGAAGKAVPESVQAVQGAVIVTMAASTVATAGTSS